jgi:methionyl-tRNA formyltransferase
MDKVVFYLMNQKGYTVLNTFLSKFDRSFIEFIVLSKDSNVKNDYFIEIRSLCEDNQILYYMKSDSIPKFNGYKFAVGWRWIIPYTDRLIILHDSLLPKYRGFSPLVNMLINGEKEIGVTALYAADEYDRGDIISQEKMSIDYPIKIENAIDRVSMLYSKIVMTICEAIFSGDRILAHPQNENQATYSLWRDEEDYIINWNKDSHFIKRMIDALSYPFKGAKSYLNGELVTISDAEVYEEKRIENRDIGKVIFIEQGYPVVVCGKGLIKITKILSSENKNLLPLKNFRIRFGGRV